MYKPLAIFTESIAIMSVLVLLNGCAATNTPNSVTTAKQNRTLSKPELLVPVQGGDGARSWRAENVDWKIYDKVFFDRIQVFVKDENTDKGIDPTDLKMLVDYFYEALVKEIKPTAQIVDKTGPGVLVVRIAITDLMPTNYKLSVAGTLTPYAFVAEAASGPASGRPAGSTPYLGECGIEARFVDGLSGEIIAEYTDTKIGKKYDVDTSKGAVDAGKKWVDGYLDSFTTWSYAKQAFDQWAELLRIRFNELRGIKQART
jgi:hypothetical protein